MSLFDSLGGGNQQHAQVPQRRQKNLAPALLQHIQGFQGNPIQELQSKLSSGEMTQEQYNHLYGAAQSIAQRLMAVLGR